MMQEKELIQKLYAALKKTEYKANEPIAVIGMDCKFPGADSPEGFWKLLEAEGNQSREIPADRWPVSKYYNADRTSGQGMYTKRGSFLNNVDQFDPAFFGIAPKEAREIDPQQRLLLENCYGAIEDAGILPDSLIGSETGVYVGVMNNDYRSITKSWEYDAINQYSATGNTFSTACGRIAYTFGLQGPCIAMDTACSSSLVALDLAVKGLRNNDCEMALVGGVNLNLVPDAFIASCRIQALAPDGQCKTFDSSADGYARGEGCGVLLLKRLSDAQKDGNRIHAIIRGTAVNQDGKSNGITAPNGLAQEKVMRKALQNAGVDQQEITYVEAHGTGTPLGDPIEMNSIEAVYGKRPSDEKLIVGSVKTNIGHTESAAGIAGVIKGIMMMKNRQVPAHLHFSEPNQEIPWDRLPIEIPTSIRNWEGDKLTMGVSSFGYSGTNSHVILQETPSAEEAPKTNGPYVVKVSAKHSASLKQKVEQYLEAIGTLNEEALQTWCYNANIRRADYKQKLAFCGENKAALISQLKNWLWSEMHDVSVAKSLVENATNANEEQRMNKHAALKYMEGNTVDWTTLYTQKFPVVSLPSYPFNKKRFWSVNAEPQEQKRPGLVEPKMSLESKKQLLAKLLSQ